MAYMRGEYYVYDSAGTGPDGENVVHAGTQFHVPHGDAFMPKDRMDDLVLMYYSRMSEEDIADAFRRIPERYGGNIGADEIVKAQGGESVFQWLERFDARLKKRERRARLRQLLRRSLNEDDQNHLRRRCRRSKLKREQP